MRRRANGEGSIFQLQDGSWRAACPGGKPSFRGATRSEAIKKRDAYLRTHHRILASPRLSYDSFGAFLRRWLDSRRASIKPRTVESYHDTITRYIIPAIGGVTLARVTPDDIAHAMARGKSPRTQNYIRTVCHIALKSAKKRHLVAENAAEDAEIVTVSKPARDMPSAEQWAAFRVALASEPTLTRALVAMIVYGGLRIGEALGLRWPDYDNGYVTILRSLNRKGELVALKSRKAIRTIPIGADASAAVEEWRVEQARLREVHASVWMNAPHQDLLFTTRYGTPWRDRNVLRVVHRLTSKTLGRRSNHYLRHLAISQLAADPTVPLRDLQEFAGHESITTTIDTYGHLISRRLKSLAAAQDRRSGRSTHPDADREK